MKNYLFAAIPLAILLISHSCKPKPEPPVNSATISIDKECFVDEFNRQVILSGVNMVNKNPGMGYIGDEGQEVFDDFNKWGFNVIRLGIIWDGLEPEPGVFNEEYLLKIDNQIRMAGEAGLHVFLDMHQDLFSVKYSDGAPEWATLNDNLPHLRGEIWSDSYLISPAVQVSFDNFWSNQEAPDGIGIQDHYKNAWKHIVSRYVDNPVVIGYDVMNEPFPGSSANHFLPVMFSAYAEVVKSEFDINMSIEDVAIAWNDQASRYEALERVSEKDVFSKVVDAVYNMNSRFEKGNLQKFYQGVTESIREIDKKKIIFLEHSYFSNSGVPTAIETPTDTKGNKDPYIAYAAHGYDLLVDTKDLGKSSTGRLDLIFSRIKESGQRMGVPVLIGEWGALGGDSPELTKLAATNLEFFEDFGFSNTYWAFHPGQEEKEYFQKELIRAYPRYISGRLFSYSNNRETSTFTCIWEEDQSIEAPTQIYIPDMFHIESITLTPESQRITLFELENTNAGFIIIPNGGVSASREIRVEFSSTKDINLGSSTGN